jgi:hypothetical protein
MTGLPPKISRFHRKSQLIVLIGNKLTMPGYNMSNHLLLPIETDPSQLKMIFAVMDSISVDHFTEAHSKSGLTSEDVKTHPA